MTEVSWSYETLAEAEVFRLADEAADRKRGAPVQPQGVEAIPQPVQAPLLWIPSPPESRRRGESRSPTTR